MEERQVTIEYETRPLPRPFLVLATQNPVEWEGTFPLAEAQLDRFLLRFRLGYPTEPEEHALLRRFQADNPFTYLAPVATAEAVLTAQATVRTVYIGAAVAGYLIAVCRATRSHDALELGASPRATLARARAAPAHAAIQGRGFVLPDDAKALAGPVRTGSPCVPPPRASRPSPPSDYGRGSPRARLTGRRVALAFQRIRAAPHRGRAVHSACRVALVRAGAPCANGGLIARPAAAKHGDPHAA